MATPPRTGYADMRFKLTRECFAFAIRAGFVVPSDLNPAAEAEGDKDKALKNDEVFGCARSVHFRDFKTIILNITHLTAIV